MAIRSIRTIGDKALTKICKPVDEVSKRTQTLIEDMIDTMYDAQGVGLAAPQVGVLKRIVVIDCSAEGNSPVIMINPEILETDGTQTGAEACLSVPGKSGVVTRPNYVKAKAFDVHMQPFEIEGTELMARAICHELEHLDGKLYVERVEGELKDSKEQEEDETGTES